MASLPKAAAGAPLQVIEMTGTEWISVPDNPRQRDTERHARKADHLKTLSPTHRAVAMAMTKGGERWKLDGHTRAWLWSRGEVQRPPTVIVTVYEVSGPKHAMELYEHFDNQKAVETATDQVSGAWREVGYHPTSSMLKRGSLTNALRIAQGCVRGLRHPARDMSVYELVKIWIAEIKLFDSLAPNNNRFTSALVAAALMTFRKHKHEAIEFWVRYNDDAGEKIENAMDAVEALSRFMMETRKGPDASSKTYDIVGKGIAACEAHFEHKTYTRGFVARDATRYLTDRYSQPPEE